MSDFAPGGLARERGVLGLGVDAFIALVSTGAYAFGDVEAAWTQTWSPRWGAEACRR